MHRGGLSDGYFLAMMKSVKKTISSAFVSSGLLMVLVVIGLSLALPLFAQDTQPLVPCSGLDCQLCSAAELIQRIIRFAILIAAPIAALLFAWAGVLYFSAAGSEDNTHKAKDIFRNAFIGFVVALLAYLIVEVLVRTLVQPGAIGNWNTIQCVSNRQGTSSVLSPSRRGTVTGRPAVSDSFKPQNVDIPTAPATQSTTQTPTQNLPNPKYDPYGSFGQ